MPSRSEPGSDPYRIRDFVADFDAIAAETAARSAALARQARIWVDCAYGNGAREKIDILLPETLRAGAPLHMFFHGGYWRSGTKEAYTCVAAPVLAVGGIAAIVEYDLMPGTRLGTLVDQVRRAASWLCAKAEDLGADPARFSVSGHSAGAHLASYLAAFGPSEAQPSLSPVAGLMLVSGIYDLVEIPTSFLKDEAAMTAEEARAYSPLTATHIKGPRRILTMGAAETAPFHDQAAALKAKLDGEGQQTEQHVFPGLNHIDIVLNLSDPSRELGQRLADLVVSAGT